jgi:hypothetical protein
MTPNPLAPRTPRQVRRQARYAVGATFNPLFAQLNRREASNQAAIRDYTRSLSSMLAPIAGQIQGYYNNATAQQQGVDTALANRLNSVGGQEASALQQRLASAGLPTDQAQRVSAVGRGRRTRVPRWEREPVAAARVGCRPDGVCGEAAGYRRVWAGCSSRSRTSPRWSSSGRICRRRFRGRSSRSSASCRTSSSRRRRRTSASPGRRRSSGRRSLRRTLVSLPHSADRTSPTRTVRLPSRFASSRPGRQRRRSSRWRIRSANGPSTRCVTRRSRRRNGSTRGRPRAQAAREPVRADGDHESGVGSLRAGVPEPLVALRHPACQPVRVQAVGGRHDDPAGAGDGRVHVTAAEAAGGFRVRRRRRRPSGNWGFRCRSRGQACWGRPRREGLRRRYALGKQAAGGAVLKRGTFQPENRRQQAELRQGVRQNAQAQAHVRSRSSLTLSPSSCTSTGTAKKR